MTCKQERGATGARPTVPAPIDLADVVTLANDAHATPLTVLAVLPETTLLTRYFVRGYDVAGQVVERVVTRLEIATAKRITPVRVVGHDGKPVEIAKPRGVLDMIAEILGKTKEEAFLTLPEGWKFTFVDQTKSPAKPAEPKPAGKLVWLPADSRGETSTHCKRFAVVKTAEGMFRGVDQRTARHQFSVRFTYRDSAQAWCEDRLEVGADATETSPTVAPAPAACVPGPEWISNGADKQGRPIAWTSKCRRFAIWPTVEKDGTHEGVYYCVDLAVNNSDCGTGGSVGQAFELCRFSPNACLDDVKRWAAERSRYTLGRDANGSPRLTLAGGVQTVPNSLALEWVDGPAGVVCSTRCGRFRVLRANTPTKTFFFALDTAFPNHKGNRDSGAAGELTRYSPNGTVETAKQWCAERAGYELVVGADGAAVLVGKGIVSSWPTEATKVDEEPVTPVDVVDWTSPAGL
jgi:hypothetical protein